MEFLFFKKNLKLNGPQAVLCQPLGLVGYASLVQLEHGLCPACLEAMRCQPNMACLTPLDMSIPTIEQVRSLHPYIQGQQTVKKQLKL